MITNEYYPNYYSLYPNTEIEPHILVELRKSDRQMQRFERDYKLGKPIYRNAFTGELTCSDDPAAIIADYAPSREISYEMLQESGVPIDSINMNAFDLYKANEYGNPEMLLLKAERYKELHNCLEMLVTKERNLIVALFWDEMTEAEYAASIGRSQSSVNEMKHRIFEKIKIILGMH
jgi:RNA polymerase sigma factor (sigma-70 family)